MSLDGELVKFLPLIYLYLLYRSHLSLSSGRSFSRQQANKNKCFVQNDVKIAETSLRTKTEPTQPNSRYLSSSATATPNSHTLPCSPQPPFLVGDIAAATLAWWNGFGVDRFAIRVYPCSRYGIRGTRCRDMVFVDTVLLQNGIRSCDCVVCAISNVAISTRFRMSRFQMSRYGIRSYDMVFVATIVSLCASIHSDRFGVHAWSLWIGIASFSLHEKVLASCFWWMSHSRWRFCVRWQICDDSSACGDVRFDTTQKWTCTRSRQNTTVDARAALLPRKKKI